MSTKNTPADWKTAEAIANTELVHEALQVFSEDPTGDNGVEVVRSVLTSTPPVTVDGIMEGGRDRLWSWFGLSYASWLTIPRVLMHEMPDEWQGKMAALLEEYDATFPLLHKVPNGIVQAVQNGKLTKWPPFILNYRRPDAEAIAELRS